MKGITRPVVILGIVSFLTDLASEMLYPIIPIFLLGVVGVSPGMLGTLEGLAEGISTGLRWVGGVLSDRARKRKPFVVAGYSISAFSKPVMGLAAIVGGWPMFLAGRASDRMGKSIRTAARDALIADATAPEFRGRAFGLHRAMDTCGAILGPLVSLAFLWFYPQTPLHYLFFIALLPGLGSALLALIALRDHPHEPHPEDARARTRFWQHFPPAYRWLLLANLLFSLGNSSDSFLIVRSVDLLRGPSWRDAGTASAEALRSVALLGSCLFALYNTLYAVAATPLGHLSDRIGRKPVILMGWLIYAAVYVGFAFDGSPWMVWSLWAVYGLYQAFAEGVSKALIADVVDARQRAGAIGLFYTVSGAGQLAGSMLAGALWPYRLLGHGMATFLVGAGFALAAVMILAGVQVPRRPERA